MHLKQINAIASYTTAGIGNITTVGGIIWSIIDYRRGLRAYIDLQKQDSKTITKEQIDTLLKQIPSLQEIRIRNHTDVWDDAGWEAVEDTLKSEKFYHRYDLPKQGAYAFVRKDK